MQQQRMLRGGAVDAITGLSTATRYSHARLGLFIKPVRIGPRASGYPESEVAAIQAAKTAGATLEEIRMLVARLHAARKAIAEPVEA